MFRLRAWGLGYIRVIWRFKGLSKYTYKYPVKWSEV